MEIFIYSFGGKRNEVMRVNDQIVCFGGSIDCKQIKSKVSQVYF